MLQNYLTDKLNRILFTLKINKTKLKTWVIKEKEEKKKPRLYYNFFPSLSPFNEF